MIFNQKLVKYFYIHIHSGFNFFLLLMFEIDREVFTHIYFLKAMQLKKKYVEF